jgi:hypothetical protein
MRLLSRMVSDSVNVLWAMHGFFPCLTAHGTMDGLGEWVFREIFLLPSSSIAQNAVLT